MSSARAAKRQHAEVVDLMNADEQSLGNAKKARTISTAHSTLPHTIIQGRLEEFSILEVRELLKALAQGNPGVRQWIDSCYDAKVEKQRSKVVRFDRYSKSAWRKTQQVVFDSLRIAPV
jgi:hypothetical protein